MGRLIDESQELSIECRRYIRPGESTIDRNLVITVCPYNLGDIVYYVDTNWIIIEAPSKCEVVGIHLTKANNRSHLILRETYCNARFNVPFHKLKERVFDTYEDAMQFIDTKIKAKDG